MCGIDEGVQRATILVDRPNSSKRNPINNAAYILTVSANSHIYQLCKVIMLTVLEMGFFELCCYCPIVMKFGTSMKLDVFYTMVTKVCDVTTIT